MIEPAKNRRKMKFAFFRAVEWGLMLSDGSRFILGNFSVSFYVHKALLAGVLFDRGT